MTNSEFANNSQIVENLLKNLFLNKGRLEEYNKSYEFPLMIAYQIPDERFFKTILNQYDNNLKLLNDENCQNLLMKMITDKKWNILCYTLDKCDFTASNETFLINMSLDILKNEEVPVFKTVISKFFQPDHILSNRESFITNSINMLEKDVPLIKMIIKSNFFDINLSNQFGETPLSLACGKKMPEIVEVLLQYGCVIDYGNEELVTIGLNEEDVKKVNKIIKLLMDYSRMNRATLFLENEFDYFSPIEPMTEEAPELYQENKILNDIIKLMVAHKGNIVSEDSSGVNIISLAYNLTHKRIFTMFINECNNKLTLLRVTSGKSLLTRIMFDNEHELLIKLLKKCEMNVEDDEFLLNLTLNLLEQNNSDVCIAVLMRCINPNKILSNEETFLTNLLKKNIDEKMFLKILELKLFDLNVLNIFNETCLIIACERLMVDMVEILLQYGSDPTIKNYKAVDVTISSGLKGSEENIQRKNKILDLLILNSKLSATGNKNTNIKTNKSVIQEIILAKQAYYSINKNDSLRSGDKSLLEMFLFAFFAKSDYMDYIFRNGHLESINKVNEVKSFLSSKIVYPLRKNGFINCQRINEFVSLIRNNNIVKKDDIDIEYVAEIVSILSHGENMLRFEGVEKSIPYISLVAKLPQELIKISIQNILNIYMAQQNKIFSEIPSYLILEVSRSKKGCSNFNNIIPSNMLDLSLLCAQTYNKCCICDNEATIFCSTCVETKNFNGKHGFKCSNHNCFHEKRRSLRYFISKSKSIIQMTLSAIISYEKDHFVVYVKENNVSNIWLSFNSIYGPNIPEVTFESLLSKFLNQSDKEMVNKIYGRIPLYLRPILNDSYIFFYENSTVTCY